MDNSNPTQQEDENCLRIEDLPREMLVKIMSYLNTSEKIYVFSMVNKQWFDIANKEIEALSIKWPQEKNQDVQNLIKRFHPRLKNLILTTKITRTNKDTILPLDSFGFDGTMEFDVSPDLIQTKNPGFTMITRIKVNPAKEKDFQKEYQVMNFKINMNCPSTVAYCDSVIEEVRSLDNVTKIEYDEDGQQDNLNLVTFFESILSRPYLKQIIFVLSPPSKSIDLFLDDLDIEEEFPINVNVEEITFETWFTPFKFLNKVLDSLPNIKKVQVRFDLDLDIDLDLDLDVENFPVFLKNISGLKHLKSLNVTIVSYQEIGNFDAQNILEIVKNNFPMNSEVTVEFIGEMFFDGPKALIEKKEGENPRFFSFFGSTKILVN